MSINLERYSKSPYETEEAWKRLAAIIENDDEAIASDEYKKYCLKSEESLLLNVFGTSYEDSQLLSRLKELHEKKYLLKMALDKELFKLKRPFVIEFTGTPRTGKTSTIKALKDFFQKAGFKVHIVEELTTSDYYKFTLSNIRKNFNLANWNLLILSETYSLLHKAMNSDADIIIVDRGINDRQIWNHCRYVAKEMDYDTMIENQDLYAPMSMRFVNVLVALKASPEVSVYRDYINSLALEPRRFNTFENIKAFNNSMDSMTEYFNRVVSDFVMIDTDNLTISETALTVANAVLDDIFDKILNCVSYF